MYVTKQILNEKHKKLMLPHNRQILNEIKAGIDDQQFRFNRNQSYQNIKSQGKRFLRPKTAYSAKNKNRVLTQQRQNRSNSFTKKLNFKIDQIKQLSNLFGKVFDFKRQKTNKGNNLPKKAKQMLNKISFKQNDQIQKSRKIAYSNYNNKFKNNSNIFVGYPKQKVRKIIPTSYAKDEDINNIVRCVKGGYVDQNNEICDTVSKSQFAKLRKNFITFDTLYTCVRGNKNKGIRQIKPQSIDRNSLVNFVYYLENQKNLKLTDKIEIQQKLKFVQ